MSIQNYFDQAQLALAAYGDLLSGTLNSAENAAELVSGSVGMTATQASAFAATWSVVTQYTDSGTGLSATVFQEVATGKRYLAIRGTNDVNDLITDVVDIALLGTATIIWTAARTTTTCWEAARTTP